jgi:diguanylate cyclase (GGDEF)-like protein
MNDRVEMLEATLDLVDGGIAILDDCSRVAFWNNAAETLTGHLAQDVICRPLPEILHRIDEKQRGCVDACSVSDQVSANESAESLHSATIVSIVHRLGHLIPVLMRKAVLRNSIDEPAGTALLFYPVEAADALPRGERGESADIERSQADMEYRLDIAHHQWITAGTPFGLLWITVDQAQALRRTHGRDACEAMLRAVEHTLVRQMKPTEIIGRWGDNEFLVLTHERTPELLVEHGRRLTGLARTADFRWWGDRVGLTVSIGVSHAADGDTLQSLLSRARQAMQRSAYAGGNQAAEARER